jgi:hypothetical protein
MDLSNLESRLKSLESGSGGGSEGGGESSTGLTIGDIKSITPYLGIDKI